MELTQNDIAIAISDEQDHWDFGNRVLYQLCRDHPQHTKADVVIGKIWLIGRSYAAAIERRKNVDPENPISNEGFYKEQVAPALISSCIDSKIDSLRQYHNVTTQSIGPMIGVHKYLVDVFKTITGQDKRSLAAKYLHFHHPDLFYIYDSYADNAIGKLMPRHRSSLTITGDSDIWFRPFALKLFDLQRQIERQFGQRLIPRQLDRLLLRVAARS